MSLSSVRVSRSVIPGVKPPIGVNAGGTDKLSGVAIDEGMGPSWRSWESDMTAHFLVGGQLHPRWCNRRRLSRAGGLGCLLQGRYLLHTHVDCEVSTHQLLGLLLIYSLQLLHLFR